MGREKGYLGEIGRWRPGIRQSQFDSIPMGAPDRPMVTRLPTSVCRMPLPGAHDLGDRQARNLATHGGESRERCAKTEYM